MHFNLTRSVAFGQQSEVAGEPVLMTLKVIEWYIRTKVAKLLVPYLTGIPIVSVSQPYSLVPSRG